MPSKNTHATKWMSDCPISLPTGPPQGRPVQVDLGGFYFTTGGICVQLNEAQIQDLLSNSYSPPSA